MSNPPPSSGGGMPKVAIVIIVIVVVVVVGCCGFFTTCNWLFHKGVQTMGTVGQTFVEEQRKAVEEAQRKAAEAQKEQQNAASNAGTSNAMASRTSVPSNGGSGSPSGSGSSTDGIVSVKIPANFPDDIPIYSGLTCTTAFSDKIKGTGAVVFTGNTAADTLSDYYEKQMGDKGWKEEGNTAINGSYIQSYSKDSRKSSISIVTEGGGKSSTVTISYQKD
jgi:hypothetical protein